MYEHGLEASVLAESLTNKNFVYVNWVEYSIESDTRSLTIMMSRFRRWKSQRNASEFRLALRTSARGITQNIFPNDIP